MMIKPLSQQAVPGRKPVMSGVPSPGSLNGVLSSALRHERSAGSGRGRGSMKAPLQTAVYEGVYNNTRMLHFLTAVVGSTCDVRVKNGDVFQGIFRTLSSKFELAVDAAHKMTSNSSVGPRGEEIVDTMVFKPMDIVLVHFRNVDFNYAMKDEMEGLLQSDTLPSKSESEEKEGGPLLDPVKKSTLNPNAKEFNPAKPLLAVNKATSTPTSPGPRSHSTTNLPMLTAGQGGMYSQYISYLPPLHMSQAVQGPQMYQYPVSNSVPGQQGKYRGAKGSIPTQRSDQHQPTSAPPIMQAATAAGPPLMAATPYSSYIYNPQPFTGQPTLMQPMAHYSSQPVFAPMLQSNPRMLSGSHPQAMVSSSTPQYPPADQQTTQALYATVHQSYPQPQHLGNAPQQQNLYHAATLTANPQSLTPGPGAQSPQNSYPQQAVYAIHAHQQLQHSYGNMAHMTQAHVQSGLSGAPPPHPGATHPTQVMLLHPSQPHGGPSQSQQSGVTSLSTSTPSPYTYLGHHQVQSHPPQQLPYHPPGN